MEIILDDDTSLDFDGTCLTDSFGRCLLTISLKGKVIVERYPNQKDNVKKIIVELYEKITEQEGQSEKILSFLNFEDESFCS